MSAFTHLGRFSAVIVLCLFSSVFAYSGGSGEPNDPYLIATAADMNSIGANSGDWGKCFKLVADIDMAGFTGTQYKIIGINYAESFTGTFDGNGYVIRNFTYATTVTNDYVGLFGYTTSATIKNLGMENVNIYANIRYMGSLIGIQAYGTVTNCYSTGNITSLSPYPHAGGLVGCKLYGAVTNCHNICTVTSSCTSSEPSWAGGLVGCQEGGTIANCYNEGMITSSSSSSVSEAGGLVGYQEGGIITNCYNTGKVASSSNYISYAGGLVGYYNNSTIEECYSTGEVLANGNTVYKGGLCGYRSAGSITNCYFLDTAGPDNGLGEPLADEQMKQQASFTGWDFTTPVWEICESTNYPKLAWQIPLLGDFGCPDGIDIYDLKVLATQWLFEGDYISDIAPVGGDGIVNFLDFALFAENWLIEQ